MTGDVCEDISTAIPVLSGVERERQVVVVGDDVEQRRFTRRDRHEFRQKVQDCLDVLATMLADATFDVGEPKIGLEIELNLVDDTMGPAMANAEVLEAIADPDYQTELGQFNIEINVAPRPLSASSIAELEHDLRRSLDAADASAQTAQSRIAMIGMLPTLAERHFQHRWLSADPRFDLLDQQIFSARGEDIEVDLTGVPLPGATAPETLSTEFDTILPEAACTSVQLHLQVAPEDFAPYWNAAQALAGVQVALAANSPFFAGKALWHETRIPLFEQATDTRPQELRNQGVRPRVWFGERWITSIFDLFEENSRYFPALLPVCSDEDPKAVLSRGGTPELAELRMHNGTVYRWNRPIYDSAGDGHHLRLENRVLPAARLLSTPWPTPRSTTAPSRCWRRRIGRCGRRCPSMLPRRTCSRRPEAGSMHASTGRRSGGSVHRNWCFAACCRWQMPVCPSTASTPQFETGTSASSRTGA